MTKGEKFFKWLDNNFGLGGTMNYEQNQLDVLRKFVKACVSDKFGFAERETLVKIAKK